MPFSGVTFAVFRFCLYASIEAVTLRSTVLRYVCAPTAPRSYGDVAFSERSCTIAIFSLYGEYVARFPLPTGVLVPCDHTLEFFEDGKHIREEKSKLSTVSRQRDS